MPIPLVVGAGAMGLMAAVKGFTSLAADGLRNSDTDYVEATKAARIEPILMLDQRLVTWPGMLDVNQTLTNIFSAYYLQAVALHVNIGSVNVKGLLDRFATNRDAKNNLANALDKLSGVIPDTQGLAYRLPQLDEMHRHPDFAVTAEDFNTDPDVAAGVDRDGIRSLGENNSLSTGKVLSVNIESNGCRGSIPVTVRLMANVLDVNTITAIMGISAKDRTLKERWYQLMGGEITASDFIFAGDLIDEYKTTAMKDKTGLYAALVNRDHDNAISAALSGKFSLGTATGLIVIHKNTAREFENKYFGKLSNPEFRNRVFSGSYAMIMAIVDTETDVVTFYTRHIETGSRATLREIKGQNKNGGPDIMEALKQMQLGLPPKF